MNIQLILDKLTKSIITSRIQGLSKLKTKEVAEKILNDYPEGKLLEIFPELKDGFYVREFTCKQCGKLVRTDDTWKDHRKVFCSESCEKKYWKHPPCDNESSNFVFYGKPDYNLKE